MNSPFGMKTFNESYRPLAIRATGACGTSFCELLSKEISCWNVSQPRRNSAPVLELEQLRSLATAAAALAGKAPYEKIVHTAGKPHRCTSNQKKDTSRIKLKLSRHQYKLTHSRSRSCYATSYRRSITTV